MKRYDTARPGSMFEHVDGDYIRLTDHLREVDRQLESALKAKDKDIQIKDGMLKLEIIAHREQLAELAEECLPHLESSLARTEKRLTKCKHDNLTKLNTLMANEKRALIAKLKSLVNK